MPISPDIHILSNNDLDRIKTAAFNRGVERGAFEERIKIGNERVAYNCANWINGKCDKCGVQSQYCEISFNYKCPHFVRTVTQSKVPE